jgi:RNA polymerase sigma factor (sigma-70 family)
MPRKTAKQPPLTPEQHALFASCLPACYHYAGTRAKAREDYDDLVSEAMAAVMRSARRFDPERKIKFCTYAIRSIHYAITNYYDKGTGKPSRLRLVSMMELPPSLSDHRATYQQDFGSDDDLAEQTRAVRRALRRIKPRYAVALRLRFFDGLTLLAMGEALGVSKERARQMVVQGLAALREEMGVVPCD